MSFLNIYTGTLEEYNLPPDKWWEMYRKKMAGPLSYYEHDDIKYLHYTHLGYWLGIVQAIVDEYGKDSEEFRTLRKRGCEDFGYNMGKKVAAWCKAQGKPHNTIETVLEGYRAFPEWNWGWVFPGRLGQSITYPLSPKKVAWRAKCWSGYFFKDMKVDPDIAALYCDVDIHYARGINPKIKMQRPHWVPDWKKGENFCEWIWEMTD